MGKFKLIADINEINRYEFVVNADTKGEAETKLNYYLIHNCPDPNQLNRGEDVLCVDRTAGIETNDVISIKIEEDGN